MGNQIDNPPFITTISVNQEQIYFGFYTVDKVFAGIYTVGYQFNFADQSFRQSSIVEIVYDEEFFKSLTEKVDSEDSDDSD